MNSVYIKGIGIAAPGLPGWDASQAILSGKTAYATEPMPKYAPGVLPANERRRATQVARLAFQAAEDAIGGIDADANDRLFSDIAAVFASSGGDTVVLNKICTMLSLPERPVSPTQFHNSVHNAPAGYWSIATGSKLPSTALSAHDGSFVAGLMEAVSMANTEDTDVLLVVYDLIPPQPLHAKRPLLDSFAAAFLLSPTATDASFRLNMQMLYENNDEVNTLTDAGLEALRLGNPAARSLPFLQQLAGGNTEPVLIAGLSGERVSLEISRC